MTRNKNTKKNVSHIQTVISKGTIHGIKYILEEKTAIYEKIFWVLVVSLAIIGAFRYLQTIWRNFDGNLMRTTIISTYYKNAITPFPSVTVCDSSRIDWSYIDKLKLEDVSKNFHNLSADEDRRLRFDLRKLLGALSIIQFGAPKDLNHVKDIYSSNKLDDLPISKILLKSVRPCEQVFERKCVWRNTWYNCCELFELQKTGYGYCYSFNSDISEKSKIASLNYVTHWIDWNNQIRPRPAAGHGSLRGLRFSVKLQKIPSYVNAKSGVVVLIGDPSGFPFENDLFVPSGKLAQIGVSGDRLITTKRLERLAIAKRSCLFPHEKRVLHRGYLRQNCIANCYRSFVQSRCECYLDFIYYQISPVLRKYPPCMMKHLKCLAEYNYAFNNHLSEETIMYDRSFEEATFCNCPDDCKNQKYIAKLTTHNLDRKTNDRVKCDVHFVRSFCTLYQSDVAINFIDAIAAYGSIAGLFLGASIISVVEILIYIGKKLHHIYNGRKSNTIQNTASLMMVQAYFEKEFPKMY